MNYKRLLAKSLTNYRSGRLSIINNRASYSSGDWRAHFSNDPDLWLIVKCWQCFFYLTDGWSVYPMLSEDADHLVKKTYMTRVEGENTRLRHDLAR